MRQSWNLLKVLALGSLCLAASAAQADDFPSRTIKIVVPAAAGGPTHITAQLLADKMQASLGQPVIVEPRPGAGNNLGAEYVAKSAPDGYTLLFATTGTHAINQTLFKKLPFDPIKDFEPVSLVVQYPLMLVVSPDLPVKSVQELIDYAKKNPGKLNYSEASASQRLSGEMFNKLAGVKIERVPYKASPQALGDVASGQVQLMYPDLPQALTQIEAGRVRGLATTGPKRTTVTPDLPAIAETVPGYTLVYWLAVFAPAATPKDIQKTLADAIAEALKDPATAKAMTQGRMEISPLALDAFADYVKSETAWWTKEIKAAGIEPE